MLRRKNKNPPAAKKSKEQLAAESGQRLEALMKALPVGITFSTDATCDFITGNPYLLSKLEMSAGDNISASAHEPNIAGAKLRHFIGGKQISGADMPMQRAIAEKRQIEPLEIEVELLSGKRWVMEAIGAPVYGDNGDIVASVAVNVDLTERKKAEEAERLKRILDQEKQKFEFISDATHELRTPLAIIRGNVDLALREKSPMSQSLKETFEAINTEVTYLANLLSDLTMLTIKDADFRRTIDLEQVDLSRAIRHIAKRHLGLAKKKGITIRVDLPPNLAIAGDESYLKRLFSNIVSNAVYYGKDGGRVDVTGAKHGRDIRIEIKDNGIGISKKDLPHIFERFYRAEVSRSKDFGGSGLGLALVKWIAEAHGGSVTAESTEGKGSIFAVTLPISQ